MGTMKAWRRVTTGAVLAATCLTTACVASPSNSPSASPTAVASISPTESAVPSQAESAACDSSAHIAGDLTLRLEHFSETGRDWIVSLYDDGRVLTPEGTATSGYTGNGWMVVRRLTDAGADLMVTAVAASGLAEASGSFFPVPLPGVEEPGRGGSGYRLTFARPSGTVEVRWTSMFGDDELYYEPSPEREQLDELAAHLLVWDEWMPDDGWAMAEPCPYVPQTARVIVRQPEEWGGSLADLPADIADVPWPLGGDIYAWGDAFDMAGTDPGPDGRCGVLGRVEAQALVDALLDLGAVAQGPSTNVGSGPWVEVQLGYREEASFVTVWIRPLLPDESGCAGANTHPFGV